MIPLRIIRDFWFDFMWTYTTATQGGEAAERWRR